MLSAIRRITGKLLLVVFGIAIWQYGDFREMVMRQFRMATAWAATDGTAGMVCSWRRTSRVFRWPRRASRHNKGIW